MNYEELLKKKEQLENELKEVQKDINNYEHIKFIEYLDVTINALDKAIDLEPWCSIEIEYECDNCGSEDVQQIDLSEIFTALKNKRKRMEK